MENDHHFLLLRGVKSILRCDQAEVVQAIAHYVVSQHRALRFLSALVERTRGTPIPAVIAVVGWLRSFLSVHSGDVSEGAVWIARLGNERRAIEKLQPLAPDLGWTELKFKPLPNLGCFSALIRSMSRRTPRRFRARTAARRLLRIARLLHRRQEFFKVLRVVELLGYYERYLDIFQKARFELTVMSSHSNPHGLAFNLAARKYRVPTVLITHGMPIRPVARLNFDLAMVHCEAARQTYLEEGCRLQRVLVHGRRQDYEPMPAAAPNKSLVVGIFLCKDVNEERLRDLVDRFVGDPRVSHVLIRPHPKNLWVGLEAWIAALRDQRVRLSSSGSVFRDVQHSDIVLAGNSSVLIDAVTAGRPSGYVHGLDGGSADCHAFVAHGLIYPIDQDLSFNPEAMLSFYQRPAWSTVLRTFSNVDEAEESVARRAVNIMRELAGS
jgi:hypothetical protein